MMLYVDNPKPWDYYDHPGTLKDDALWRLMVLFLRKTDAIR
jgi:hypothetical protein